MDNKKFSLEQEERCGHLVTEQVKKLWSVELELADQLKRICEKHGLRYYAGGGTLLGAVRHQGFIPWDDDMDFFMTFEDYCKLQEVAPKELRYPYAFQDYHNTKDAGSKFARIRKSDTTGCTEKELTVVAPHNLGIFIDVFPLFYVPENKIVRKMQYWCIKILRYGMSGHIIILRKNYDHSRHQKIQLLIWRVLSVFMNFRKLCDVYLKVCNWKPTKYLGLSSFLPGQDKYVWKKEWFRETVELPFEDRMVPCPKEYEQVLTHQYGDWTKPVKGGAIHSIGVIDPDKPYWVTFQDRFGDLHEYPETETMQSTTGI